MSYALRPYQQDLVDFALPRLRKSKKPLLVNLGTGAGKTWCVAEVAKQWGENVLVLTVSKELCEQDYEKLKIVASEENVGIYSASWNKKEVKPITVATIQSAYKHPEIWQNHKLIIADECDSFPLSGMLSELLEGKQLFGLTATPYATQGSKKGRWFTTKLYPLHKIKDKKLGWFWQPVEFNVSEKYLQEHGYLCQMKIYSGPIKCHLLKTNSNGSEYTLGSIDEWVAEIYDRIIEVIKGAERTQMCKNCGIIFMPSVESCELLEQLCAKVNIDARAVSYKTPSKERDQIISDHKTGKLKWLINQGVCVRGFDNVSVDCLIIARPTRSLRLHRQCLPEDAEILTADGWKGVNDIAVGDKLPNFNLSTQQGDWDEVLDVVKRTTGPNEKWVEYNGQSHRFKVTDGHNLLISHGGKEYFLTPANTITTSFTTPTTLQLPKEGIFIEDFWGERRLASPTEMWLVGMLLTDGCWAKGKQGISQIRLSQSMRYPYIIQKIEDACRELRIHYNKRLVGKVGDERTIFGNPTKRNYDMYEYSFPKVEMDYLLPFLDKSQAKWAMQATREQILALLDGMFDGNGTKRFTVTDYTIRTKDFFHPNKTLVDDILSACVTNNIQAHITTQGGDARKNLYKFFYCPTKNSRSISPPSKTEQETRKRMHRWLEKSDCHGEKCWCVETKNKTIVVRYHGYVTVMGNCLGRGLRICDGKDVCNVIDLTENCKTWGGPADVVMGKNGWQDTILLRGKDINGMEISKINLANVRKKSVEDGGEQISRRKHYEF